MKGWRTGAFFLGVAVLDVLLNVFPMTRGLIPEEVYRWSWVVLCGLALFFRHISDGPPAWKGRWPFDRDSFSHGGSDMKKPIGFMLLFVVLLFTASVFAGDVEEPAAADHPFSITLGSGHIWSGSGDWERSVNTAEAQVHLGGDWRFTDRFGLTFEYVRDTAELKEWLYEHRFTSELTETRYNYNVADLACRVTFNPGDRAEIYALAGGSFYKSGGLSKGGFLAGVGLDYGITDRAFLRVLMKYRHVEGFLVPVANVVETGFGIGFRF